MDTFEQADCPNCGSDDSDFTNNDEMVCRSCGFEWINPQPDD